MIEKVQNIKNNRLILIIAVSILIAIIIFGLGLYLFQKSVSDSKTQITQVTEVGSIDTIFENLPQELLRRDSKIILTPNVGYLITTSILSNKKDKIVYSEISDCIRAVNNYGVNNQTCNWKYYIFVKDLKTNKLNTIYSYPESTSFFQNMQKLIVNEAQAGGCPLVYFPIAWSKNDQKIILQWGNPTSCGAGGAPQYLTYTLSPDGGSLEDLSTYQPIFLDNYNKVIFIGESAKSPSECGLVTQKNFGKIVLKYIETGEIKVLLEEENSFYSSLQMKSNETLLSYSVKKVKNVNGCSEANASAVEKIEQIHIPS